MSISQEQHFVVRVEIVEVTNFFESTAYGSGHRPSGYKKEELEKQRRQNTIVNFTASQPDLLSALALAAEQVALVGRHAEGLRGSSATTVAPPTRG